MGLLINCNLLIIKNILIKNSMLICEILNDGQIYGINV
jgi:hypothetical protein